MTPKKFNIETLFAADGTILREPGGRNLLFTAAEVEAMRAESYAAGQRDETARAEQRAADALKAFAATARELLGGLSAEVRVLREEAGTLAFQAARAIAGAALDQWGEERVRAALAEALDGLRQAPRLLIKLPADSAERLAPDFEQLAAEHGFAGAIVVRADPAMRIGDVALDWGDGAVRLDRAEITARVEEIVSRALTNAISTTQGA